MREKIIFTICIIVGLIMLSIGCITEKNSGNTSNEIPDEVGYITFDYPPVDLGDRLGVIKPMGAMTKSHVTPVDHQYYLTPDWMSDLKIYNDIYSPADGTITDIQMLTSQLGNASDLEWDYRLIIRHTSTIQSIFIHIDELSSKIAVFAPTDLSEVKVDISVEAGEIIGRWRGQLDYNVVDADVTLSGFINPESYNIEPWKIHVSDPFDYFNESIKSQMIEKCVRIDEPLGGKIDYDVDGRLVGTWFKENTNKYEGLDRQGDYWEGHLTVAYDYIDPEQIVISIGSFDGEPRQFGVVGNSPDPADVNIESGLVSYELFEYWYYDLNEEWWDEESVVKGLKSTKTRDVPGVILFQLIEDQKLKVETFPGKAAEEVTGFTNDVMIYER